MGLPLGLLLVLQQPIIVDGHIDTPQRMLDMKADISARLTDGHIDVPRMREGGLTAPVFSIGVDARYARGTAVQRAAPRSRGTRRGDRKSTRLNARQRPTSSAVYCFQKNSLGR